MAKKNGNFLDEVKGILRSPKPEKASENGLVYLPTGLTLLNLACSGRPDGGFSCGRFYYLVGDSRSGKTFLSLTCLAEAARHPAFKSYRFIFDNAEDGALMDFPAFFGTEATKRIEAPGKKGQHSSTVEAFYFHLDDAARAGRPFIYILDSMDALYPEADEKKFRQHKQAHARKQRQEDGEEKSKEPAGSYGVAKAKLNSSHLRLARNMVQETGSILIVISQTRDNLGFGFKPKTRGGGHALTFYATEELWFSVVGKIKKTVRGKDRTVGDTLKIRVEKNRQTGREASVEVPFYPAFGFDDLGSCVNYLLLEKHWSKAEKGSKITAPEFGFEGTAETLIRKLEAEGKADELRQLVARVWAEVEEESRATVVRQPRYQ
jgi:RecA/RadA recombinase